MSITEILNEVPKLSPEERGRLRAKLDELDDWIDDGELSERDKVAIQDALAAYDRNPNAGSSWEEVEARLRSRLRK